MKTIAIITGAATGLGKEFVQQINVDHIEEIWAIDIDEQNLKLLTNIVSTPIKKLVLDLSKEDSYKQIKKLLETEKPNVKWLINSAGVAYFGSYDEINYEDALKTVDVNSKSIVAITSLAIKYMKEYARIINVASVASFVPLPYVSVFAATQSFLLSYSRAMNQELKRKNIVVTCVCPYWTQTNFVEKTQNKNHNVISYFPCMYDPTLVAKKAIKDAIAKKRMSVYGFKSKLVHLIAKYIPFKFVVWYWQKQQKLFDKYPIPKKSKK